MVQSKLWGTFYKMVQEVGREKYGCGAAYYHSGKAFNIYHDIVNSEIDFRLRLCEIYLDNDNIIGFPLKDKLKEIADKYTELTHCDDIRLGEVIKNDIYCLARALPESMKDYVHNSTMGRKLAIKILNGLKEQDDPSNRMVVNTITTEICNGVCYKVTVTSNYDGWAEDTKDIGFTLDPNLSLNGKTEKESKEMCEESVVLLAELLKKLNDEEVDDEGCFVDTELTKVTKAIACGLLINSDGSRNITNERKLKNLLPGVTITAGDSDSFGWLVGCINTRKGTLCYG